MPLTNKRAEGRNMVLVAFAIIGVALISALVLAITALSVNTRNAVINQTDDYYLTSSTVVHGLFSIVAARYVNTDNASCTLAQDYTRPVIMTMSFNAYEIPNTCSLFVNDALIQTYNRLAPDCRISCDFQQFNREFSIGAMDYRDDHTIKVCCDGICLQKGLPGLCGTQLQP